MRIAVDVMGGDFAPRETVAGAVQAAREMPDTTLVLVGDRQVVADELARQDTAGLTLELAQAGDVITMAESPAAAVRAKPEASIVVATEMVKRGEVDALATVGHTGAGMVAAVLILGRIPGAKRPTVGVPILGLQPQTFFWDVGANVDCKPMHLLQFGLMGSLYVELVEGIENPTVALLTNGLEDSKGDSLTQAAFSLLAESDVNFVGNVEALNVIHGQVNVAVCDGLVGNVLLKTIESLSNLMLDLVEADVGSRLPAHVARDAFAPALGDLRQRTDYAEIGAVPLLGVQGHVVIGHGRSQAKAVKAAIHQARRAAEADLVSAITQRLAAP
ncbi:MAG: Phosphate acyltransferase [Anaerolineales bacterium]|nr:Phosphate acyltransferase [Anaerolineales bacterium]